MLGFTVNCTGHGEVKVIHILSTLLVGPPLLKTYDIVVHSVK